MRERDRLPDWFVGGAGKRRLLRAVLADAEQARRLELPDPPWTKAQLARAAGLHEKHTVFRHVEVLVQAGVLDERADGYRPAAGSPLLAPLAALLRALEALPEAELPASRGRTPRAR